MRASYHESFERRNLIEPGQVYRLEIETDAILATSNLFAEGHRIRIDVASSNYPAFDVNPGNGEHVQNVRSAVAARNTLFHDAKRPSHVVLPVVPL